MRMFVRMSRMSYICKMYYVRALCACRERCRVPYGLVSSSCRTGIHFAITETKVSSLFQNGNLFVSFLVTFIEIKRICFINVSMYME